MKVRAAMSEIAEMVRAQDPDRFLVALFAPAEQRENFLLLCAFNNELARAREVASQPLLALIRLQWWREVVQGTKRRHEVAGPLGAALDAGVFDRDDLLAMIEAREQEADDAIEDLASWHRYLAGAAGGFAVAAGRMLGADAVLLTRLRLLGAAYGAAGQLGSIAALAHQQRCQLPLDVLGAHGLTQGHVLQDPRAADVVRPTLAEEGLRLWRHASGPIPRAIIAAALPAVLAKRDLRRGYRHRGLSDKLAVLAAAAIGRI